MRHDELILERKCCDFARQHGWLAVKLENNEHKGIPDRLFIRNGGECFFVEFKNTNGKGRTTPQQEFYQRKLAPRVCLCSSFDDFVRFMRRWMPIPMDYTPSAQMVE